MSNYHSLYRGIVEDNIDPENLGRCKIRVPSIHGELKYPINILPWARPLVTTPVSKGKGSVNIPDVGDIVWVIFEGSIKDFPVYLGGTYARDELDINNNRVDFYIEGDTNISYDRLNKEYTIKVGNNSFKISNEGVTIKGKLIVEGNIVYKELINSDN